VERQCKEKIEIYCICIENNKFFRFKISARKPDMDSDASGSSKI
jgi:hypothetical protein